MLKAIAPANTPLVVPFSNPVPRGGAPASSCGGVFLKHACEAIAHEDNTMFKAVGEAVYIDFVAISLNIIVSEQPVLACIHMLSYSQRASQQ